MLYSVASGRRRINTHPSTVRKFEKFLQEFSLIWSLRLKPQRRLCLAYSSSATCLRLWAAARVPTIRRLGQRRGWHPKTFRPRTIPWLRPIIIGVIRSPPCTPVCGSATMLNPTRSSLYGSRLWDTPLSLCLRDRAMVIPLWCPPPVPHLLSGSPPCLQGSSTRSLVMRKRTGRFFVGISDHSCAQIRDPLRSFGHTATQGRCHTSTPRPIVFHARRWRCPLTSRFQLYRTTISPRVQMAPVSRDSYRIRTPLGSEFKLLDLHSSTQPSIDSAQSTGLIHRLYVVHAGAGASLYHLTPPPFHSLPTFCTPLEQGTPS